MATLPHDDRFPARAARRGASRPLLVAAGLFWLALIVAIAAAPERPADPATATTRGPEAAAPAVRTLEDWRGNSARFITVPAD